MRAVGVSTRWECEPGVRAVECGGRVMYSVRECVKQMLMSWNEGKSEYCVSV